MGSMLTQWEAEQAARRKRLVARFKASAPRYLRGAVTAAAGFAVGVHFATLPAASGSTGGEPRLRDRAVVAESELTARLGELDLFRLELNRLRNVMNYSSRYRIPADLAADIYDHALSEGIQPRHAFRLVAVESGFSPRAISHKGAVGLTQLMPSTAFGLEPGLRRADLFDRDTNLRLGFRYLRQMLHYYDGDLRLALLAYNRGPGTVDSIRGAGRDPANGYARKVLTGEE